MSTTSSVEHKYLNQIFFHVTEFKNQVEKNEVAYKAEIARLETVIASLEAEIGEITDPMRAEFVNAGTWTLAKSRAPWGVKFSPHGTGYMVFASEEARAKWRRERRERMFC